MPVLVRGRRQCAIGDLGVMALIGQVAEPLLLEGNDNEKVISVQFLLEQILCINNLMKCTCWSSFSSAPSDLDV